MSISKWTRWIGVVGIALAVACGGEERKAAETAVPEAETGETAEAVEAPEPAAEPAAKPAGEPAGPRMVRTVTPDGEIFEAEYGKADQLPSDFPEDVPVYGDARPLSSMASPEHGTVVNLRSADPPEKVFAWYRDHYGQQGWTVEHAEEARGRSTLVVRKGNRVSSVVIQAVPGATQTLLTVTEDR
jgi:hypothetical protein